MHTAIRKILLIGLCLLYLSACIPTGLPEYFSGVVDSAGEQASSVRRRADSNSNRLRGLLQKADSNQRPVFLLSEPESQEGGLFSRYDVLGHQYLLGVIPFTSIFLEHGEKSFLSERTIDVLRAQGLQPLLLRAEDVLQARALFDPFAVIRPKIEDLSLNAYDLFFFRVLSISGEFQLDQLSGKISAEGEFVSRNRIRLPLSESKLRRYAHGPTLSYHMEYGISQVLEQAFARGLSPLPRQKGKSVSLEAGAKPLLLVEFPQFAKAPEKSLANLLSSSYGYGGLAPYPLHTMQRLLQRGIRRGLEAKEFSVLSYVAAGRPRLSPYAEATSWSLRTLVRELKPRQAEGDTAAGLGIVATFSLYERRKGRSSLLFSTECSGFQELLEDGDGYWVRTLEQAAAHLVTDFMQGSATAVCREL